jgi:hypothetical protein
MKINAIRYVSEPPVTPFAPTWDFTLANAQTDIDLDALKDLILEKEIEIKEEFPADVGYLPLNDGQTGLGPNSLTARFKYFNVLKWDHPVCKQLYEVIREVHQKYYDSMVGGEFPKLKIRCWANVLRKGESIGKHSHAVHPHTYLSGHFCVSATGTSTNYIPPYNDWGEDIIAENIPGEITIFPTWLAHYTSVTQVEEPRITIAFDIVPAEGCLHPDEDNLVEL